MSLNVAIAGAGYIAAIHAKAIRNSGGEVAAVVGRSTAKTDAFAQAFHIPKHYATAEELVNMKVVAAAYESSRTGKVAEISQL